MSETTASLERKIRNVKALQSVVRTMNAMAGRLICVFVE